MKKRREKQTEIGNSIQWKKGVTKLKEMQINNNEQDCNIIV